MHLSYGPHDDDAARALIDTQLRRPDEKVWSVLLSDDYARQTHRVLCTIEDATMSSLTHRGEDIANDRQRFLAGELSQQEFDALVDNYSAWRKRVTHVQALVKMRKRQAADRADALRGYTLMKEVRDVLITLAAAVAEHRDASAAAGIEPEGHDRLLWLRLQTLQVPVTEGRRHVTLQTLLNPTPPTGGSERANGRRHQRTGRRAPKVG